MSDIPNTPDEIAAAGLDDIAREPQKAQLPPVTMRANIPPAVECRTDDGRRPSEVAREQFGNNYGWCRHEQVGSRAAQRRLRQRQHQLQSRCRTCGHWYLQDAITHTADGSICHMCRQAFEQEQAADRQES